MFVGENKVFGSTNSHPTYFIEITEIPLFWNILFENLISNKQKNENNYTF